MTDGKFILLRPAQMPYGYKFRTAWSAGNRAMQRVKEAGGTFLIYKLVGIVNAEAHWIHEAGLHD